MLSFYHITIKERFRFKAGRLFFCLIFFVFSSSFSRGQSARVTGMGGFSDAVEDPSHVFRNPALVAGGKSTVFQASVENRFGMRELTNRSLLASTSISYFQLGLGYSLFGVQSYSNQTVSGTVSIRTSAKSRVGIRTAWYQSQIQASENQQLSAPLLGAGFYYNFLPQWSWGMQFSVFSKQIYQVVPANIEPSFFSTALCWKPLETFKLTFGGETNQHKKMRIRSGLEWQLAHILALRIGVAGNPAKIYAGFGINHKSLIFDFSIEKHQILGYSPSISLTYSL